VLPSRRNGSNYKPTSRHFNQHSGTQEHGQPWDWCRMVVLQGWSHQWSWKSGGEFPAKKLRTVVSLACVHDWGDAQSPFHDKNSYFLEKDDSDISIILEFIILSWVNLNASWVLSIYRLNAIQRQSWPWPRSDDWRCNIKWGFYTWPLYFVVFVHEWLCMYE
jgi:hypothetical protein